MKSEPLKIDFKEKDFSDYNQVLLRTFGGEIKANTYTFSKGNTKIKLYVHSQKSKFEILLSDTFIDRELSLDFDQAFDAELIVITLINKGEITSLSSGNSNIKEATEANLFIMNVLEPIHIQTTSKSRCQSLTLKLTLKTFLSLAPNAHDIYRQLFPEKIPYVYYSYFSQEINQVLSEVFNNDSSSPAHTSLVLARSLEILSLLINTVSKLKEKDELRGLHIEDYKRMQKAKELLLSSFEKRMTINDLALEVGISTSKLSRDFKKLFNKTIYQFYTDAKMNEAYSLLKSGKYSVQEICFNLGYENHSKFTKMFKKHKGLCPRDVIKECLN
ncbi:helix-turn-helix domain-containing protein [Aureibacter tunicatorum]|uniref:AraC-like DNA-binding protein n=1 Tax=Aureibacter tunicatorum TaxID=866807 RepID=A0AAE4BTB7_9BACT|nr:AraC family transcriptional regulator [Aureibacter tunicatorum]MDR6240626.1 AraC-like DNA-binding protein [Aureibacter tunicatorum]BDD06513.1 hypothetical protein AUTU_39960 [Aureibacter tunicatorum]